MRLVLLLLCAFTSIAQADQRECLTLPPGRTVEVVGSTLYALHDGNTPYQKDLFVIALGSQPKLISRTSFTQIMPYVIYLEGPRLWVTGYEPRSEEIRVVELDLRAPAAPRLVEPTLSGRLGCELRWLRPTLSTPDGDVRVMVTHLGHRIEVRRPPKPIRYIDHGGLVTLNHWERIRALPPGTCEKVPYYCSQANLDPFLRAEQFELVTVKDRVIYSLTFAGLAAHDLDTLQILGAARWPTLQATPSTATF